MNDLISRQAAIDVLDKRFDDVPMELTTEILQLRRDLRERIPSAQPATSCSEIPNGSDDTISRQAAIDALDGEITVTGRANAEAVRGYARLVADRLKRLPSAQPEPKRGKWIYCEDSTADCVDGYRCDQCGFFTPWDYQHKSIDYIKDYNFCPNCGADMRGEQDG